MNHMECITTIVKSNLKIQCLCDYSDVYLLGKGTKQLREDHQMLLMQINEETKEIKN